MLIALAKSHKPVVIKHHGELYFHEKTERLILILNTDSYIDELDEFKNKTMELRNICPKLQYNATCMVHVQNFEREIIQMTKNVNLFRERQKRRVKRGFFEKTMETMKYVFLAEWILPPSFYGDKRSDISSIMKSHLIDEFNKTKELEKMHVLEKAYEELRELLEMKMYAHHEQTNLFREILSVNFRENIFDVLDIEIFRIEVQKIALNLETDKKLISDNPIDLIEFSSLFVERDNNSIAVYIDLPIVNTTPFLLNEVIPVPIRKNNQTHILNLDSFYYSTHMNGNMLIRREELSQCKKWENTTLCEPFMKTTFTEPSNCALAIIYNTDCDKKYFKEIESTNYLMHISPQSIYYSVVKPMNLYIECARRELKWEIRNDGEILWEDDCEIVSLTSLRANNSQISTIEWDFSFESQNFTLYDIDQNYTYNYTMMNKYEIELLKRIELIGELANRNLKSSNSNNTNANSASFSEFFTSFSLFGSIQSFFSEISLGKYLIYALCAIVGGYIILSVCISLTTNLFHKIVDKILCCKRK